MIPEQWSDTMITAATCGLPMSLGGAGKALDLPQDAQKDRRGKELIRYFCVPCKPHSLMAAERGTCRAMRQINGLRLSSTTGRTL